MILNLNVQVGKTMGVNRFSFTLSDKGEASWIKIVIESPIETNGPSPARFRRTETDMLVLFATIHTTLEAIAAFYTIVTIVGR